MLIYYLINIIKSNNKLYAYFALPEDDFDDSIHPLLFFDWKFSDAYPEYDEQCFLISGSDLHFFENLVLCSLRRVDARSCALNHHDAVFLQHCDHHAFYSEIIRKNKLIL